MKIRERKENKGAHKISRIRITGTKQKRIRRICFLSSSCSAVGAVVKRRPFEGRVISQNVGSVPSIAR